MNQATFKTDQASIGKALNYLHTKFAKYGEPDGEDWSGAMLDAAIRFDVDQTALEDAYVQSKCVPTNE